MTATPITSGQAGTPVVTAAGTLKGLALTMPIAANADAKTPLILTDSASAAAGPLLFSASLSDLQFIYMTKPTSVPITPGGPAAPPPGTVFAGAAIPFANGVYVKSSPANVTFTMTT